ncbi:MAG: hypothetical protein U0075_24715 [Thermomicrobiales bacterium]
MLDAAHIVGTEPEVGRCRVCEVRRRGPGRAILTEMLESQQHTHQPIGDEPGENTAAYAEELKLVNVFQQNTDPVEFANKVYADVLTQG